MQALNPYLRAFFRSALPAQCQPIANHILLVPTTEVLLHSRERDSNTPYADLAGTEEFLASHVLRVPEGGPTLPVGQVKDLVNARESKSKAKQYTTLNGRVVIIKDAFVYSNKGFKTLNQAQLLSDTIYYPDVPDGQQWLVYYISKPLIGALVNTTVPPAIISDEPSTERKKALAEATGAAGPSTEKNPLLRKKEIKSFADLLNQFPMISRHMTPSLEKAIGDFISIHETRSKDKSSRRTSVSSHRSTPSITDSLSSIKSSLSGASTVHPTALELESGEEVLRTSLENAVISAIDSFQRVDRHQLSLLGTNTELTGPAVEKLIERYIAEQIYDQILFPQLCAIRRLDDSDLDRKIRKMTDIDIGQAGITIEGGMRGKRALAEQLTKGVTAFQKMGTASSPQEMLDILLNTQKVVSASEAMSENDDGGVVDQNAKREKQTPMTISADVLVSMLLIVIVRSGVRHLHSRLVCMRYFIFTDEVESGEQGYALATLEAVLAHLSSSSHALRNASKQNKLLWQAVRDGDTGTVRSLLRPDMLSEDALQAINDAQDLESAEDGESDGSEEAFPSTIDRAAAGVAQTDFAAVNGSLQHVFPFQKPPTPPPEELRPKARKRVSMASISRSQSVSSAQSSRTHSRQLSVDSSASTAVSNDLSAERLAQTQDREGNSVLRMALDAGQRDMLKLLLSMPAHFNMAFVLDDADNEGLTLLSAVVQSEDECITEDLIDWLENNATEEELHRYLRAQDKNGRCFAHYLFHQPQLIHRYGQLLPWRLKDKNGQTPLFALCRSYDHPKYRRMVDSALAYAAEAQDDDEPLHLDDHIDNKGNTLLHIVNDVRVALDLLRRCDSDANAPNDKRFTPLMMGSKYGRVEMVRALFGDPRVDSTLRDVRELSAVELAKDDDIRNRIDDLVLLSSAPGHDGRTTTIVRSFFVEDSTLRFVLKSAAPSTNGMVTVTTCRRSVADFENLAKWLSIECPASWLPTQFNLPSPFLIQSRPSRAILRDTQIRIDNFFKNLLAHGTFSTHELVWEFFLVPEVDAAMLSERSRRKAEARIDNVKDDYEPVTDAQEVEDFVTHARDQVKNVAVATRKVMRTTNRYRTQYADLVEAKQLCCTAFQNCLFLPQTHTRAFERYTRLLPATDAFPPTAFYYALHGINTAVSAIQAATTRPTDLIAKMAVAQRTIDRSMGSLARSARWTPSLGGLFDDVKRAVAHDAWDKAGKARVEVEALGCELRYTQQTIAGELAAWQEEHVNSGKEMLRKLARDTIVKEKAKLEGMIRALREIRKTT